MISIRHLSFSYGKRRVFSDFNLEIPEGQVCLLTGINGVGKSTLLRLIAGVLRPIKGTIVFPETMGSEPKRKTGATFAYIAWKTGILASVASFGTLLRVIAAVLIVLPFGIAFGLTVRRLEAKPLKLQMKPYAGIAAAAAAQTPPAIGDPAPAFKLKSVAGNEQSLADFKGKIVVLEWTNPGCPIVQRHYRDGLMPAAQKAAKEKGVIWLAVNSTNPGHSNYREPAELSKIYTDWQAAYTTQLMDADGVTGLAYGAKTTPHIFVIDTQGKIAYNGAIDDDTNGTKSDRTNYALAAIDALLAGKPVAVSTTQPYGCSVKYK
jgi:energy-coupling factor transporter ATP-binding protein EcfA2